MRQGIFSKKLKMFQINHTWSFGENKYYAIRIEFQERASLHFHLFIWIFNAPNMENEAAYIEFIEKTLSVQLPDHLNYPEFFELVQTYLVHAHSRT